MSLHFSQLKQMKTLLASHGCHDGSSLDKGRVLSLLLHSCDVAHPAKTWGLHHQWTSRCMQEFFKQGDLERDLGLEFSPLCDRHNTMVPQSQIGDTSHHPATTLRLSSVFLGFIDFIVIPTLSTCGEMIKTVLGSAAADFHQPWTETLQENRNRHERYFTQKQVKTIGSKSIIFAGKSPGDDCFL